MKHITGITILTLAISGLLAGRKRTGWSGGYRRPCQSKTASEEPKKCDRWKEKKSAWKRWNSISSSTRTKRLPDWMGRQDQGNHKSWEEKRQECGVVGKLPALDRMEKMLAFFQRTYRPAEEARLAATKVFYATCRLNSARFSTRFQVWASRPFWQALEEMTV